MGKLFYVPKHEKIKERTMTAHVVLSVTVVVMCLVAMTLSAYAFFSYNLSSNSNVIEAARFEVDIAIQVTDQEGNSVDISKVNRNTSKVKLLKDSTYEITIENSGTASTGFCVISADNCDIEQLHTQQIYNKKNAEKGEATKLTFEMKVTNDTEVTFYAHWGTSSHYDEFKSKGKDKKFYITQGETVELNISGAEQDEDEKSEQKQEQSEAPGNGSQAQGVDVGKNDDQSEEMVNDKNEDKDNQQDNSSAGGSEAKATSAPESSLESEDTSAIGATSKPM